MAQILVRKLPEGIVERLKARAKRHGRSLEAEVGDVLQQAVTKEKAEFLETADAMRARLAGSHHTGILELLREDRDR